MAYLTSFSFVKRFIQVNMIMVLWTNNFTITAYPNGSMDVFVYPIPQESSAENSCWYV